MKRFLCVLICVVFLLIPALIKAADSTYDGLMASAQEKGFVKVILKLDVKDIKQLTEKSTQFKTILPGARFPSAGFHADLDLEMAIQSSTNSVLYRLNAYEYNVNHMFTTVPFLALDVSPEALAQLPSFPEVLEIIEDLPVKLVENWKDEGFEKHPLQSGNQTVNADKPMLDGTVGIIGADNAWAMGYTGTGWYVAILDTGIRKTHQFFTGKTIKEACFSANGDCPNGSTSMYGSGAAAHYESTYEGFDHGTHVAGIAAGKYGSLAGVAKSSNIIAVQVFSRFGSADCGGSPCVLSYSSDQVKGLEYIYSLRSTYSIASVNMSLGGGSYNSYCTSALQKSAIDNLKAVRIATVVATGNDGYCGYISSPACVPSAIAIGASSNTDTEAYFNNWHSTLQELFAPGVSIYSSTGDSNTSYESWNGTSMATPHVAGAWALMRQASPTASVDTIYNALKNNGVSVSTLCSSGGSCPRIQLDDAIDDLIGGTVATITVTSPNGGESWNAGTSHAITWTSTGTVGNVKIEYTSNGGSSWTTVVASTTNDGAYTWSVPNVSSSHCKVRVKEASDSSPSDTSNNEFTIVSNSTPTLTVTSPNGGEKWEVGSKHTITWTSTGTVGSVKIEYTTNNGSSWSTVVSSTTNDGAYSWTIPNALSTKCKVRIKEASDGSPADLSDAVFSIIDPTPPEISLSRTTLNFSGIANNSTAYTGTQVVWLNNTGGGTLTWSANSSATWLTCSPETGTDSGVLSVSINSSGLTTGTYSSIISVNDPDASNSPQTITVSLKIINSSQDKSPFGEFATPSSGATVMSSIPVTGWVLDDIEVQSVKVYINNGYVGDAVFVEGARPDVESAYPGYPKNYRGGWGYMLLTNVLTDGNKTLSVIAQDNTGHKVTLGTRNIIVDNGHAVKPFGAMDTPAQGGGATGKKYRNQGWALTPQPNKIPVDGSTIKVYVDGKYLGHANYNIYRADIAGLFPGYANSDGSLGYYELDTTLYENGVHTIQWTATDNGGNSDGIGSRYFSVQNTGTKAGSGELSYEAGVESTSTQRCFNTKYLYKSVSLLPVNPGYFVDKPVKVITGFNESQSPQVLRPDNKGIFTIESKELERIEIALDGMDEVNSKLTGYSGYLVVGDKLRLLPIGSTLDPVQGRFYWQPGSGFLGMYELVFIAYWEDVPVVKRVKVNILPKY